jgi:hypothetical protein
MNQSRKSPSSNVALTPKQANIFAWGFQPCARFRDGVCGRRFGKTFLGAKEMRRAAKLAARWQVSTDDEIWYAAPTFKQAKRVFWRRLKKAIPPSWREGKPNETECSITLKSGHVMRIVGLDNYDNLRGSGLFFVLVDEWADCPYEAWEEVLRPMLSTCRYWIDGVEYRGGHALRIGTPKGFNHCYDTWLDGQPAYPGGPTRQPDHKSWLYTSEQGGNVPAEELEAARRKMDPRTYRQEYQASFENYQGLIYYCFDRRLNHTDDTVQPYEDLHIGMDFNVSKMAAIVHVLRNDSPRAVDEFTEVFDTPAMIEAIQLRFPGHKVTVYPDASGQNRKTANASESDLSLLRKAGFLVVVDESNPSVKDRINSVNAMLCNTYGERRYLVNTAKCGKYTTSLERQIYREKPGKPGEFEPDKTGGFDHSNDAGGYFIVKRWPLGGPQFVFGSV